MNSTFFPVISLILISILCYIFYKKRKKENEIYLNNTNYCVNKIKANNPINILKDIKNTLDCQQIPNSELVNYIEDNNYLSEQQFINEFRLKLFTNSAPLPNDSIDQLSQQIKINNTKSKKKIEGYRQTSINMKKFVDRIYNLIINEEPVKGDKQEVIEKYIKDIFHYEAYLPDFIKSTEVLLLEIEDYLNGIISDVNPDLKFKCECIDPIIGDDQRGIKKAIDIIGSKNNRQNLLEELGISRMIIIGLKKSEFYNNYIQPYVGSVVNGICQLYLYRNIQISDVSGIDFFNENRINVELIDELFFYTKIRFKTLFGIEFVLPQLCHDKFDENVHSDKYTKSILINSGFTNVIDKIEKFVIYDLISPGIRTGKGILKKPEVIYKVL